MNFGLSFTNPWALLLFVPFAAFFVWTARQTLADLSSLRAKASLGLRLFIAALLVLALAGAQQVRFNRDLAVMFVLDNSDSLSPDAKTRAQNFIAQSVKGSKGGDRWGTVVFGREAQIERAPSAGKEIEPVKSVVAGEFTDIAAAMRLASASLPDGFRKRLVVLTDGNENLGDALAEAQTAGNAEIAVDVVPISSIERSETLIEKLTVPGEAKIGEPVEIRVLARSTSDTSGTVKLFRDGKFLGTKKVQLTRGKNVFVFPQSVEESGSATFEAQLETPRGTDTQSENNRGLGFVSVAGRPRVLLVDNDPAQGRFLISALQREKVNVEARGAGGLPQNLREMQPYDAIILNNVAAWEMSAEQMLALQSYVRDFGCGLVMVGGENSFGPGGYRSTPVEASLPVTMDIRNRQYIPGGAVALVMHSLEFPQGNDWAKSVCSEVTRQLGDEDYSGLIVYGFAPTWVYPMLKTGNHRNEMLAKIRGINPGDMPDFDAALRLGYSGLIKTPAYLKHIIILSDGDPSPPAPALTNQLNAARITVSTVVINPHDNSGNVNMYNIAKAHGGRFYRVTNPKQIPKIFLKEAATVQRSAIIEGAFTPRVQSNSTVLKGIDGLPQLLGYVGTSPRPPSQGARVILSSADGDPILATRQYGLGKSVAFTSDARQRWAAPWLPWSGYSKFWAQTVRWSMRQSSANDLQTNVEIDKGRGRVTIEAVDAAGNFQNFLNPKARLVPPSFKSQELALEQTGPGRYEASFDARDLGTYLLNIRTVRGDKTVSQIAGGVLPYSPEYAAVGSNTFLLSQIAEVSLGEEVTANEVFTRARRPARMPKDIWLPLLALAALLFPLDVAARRLLWDDWANRKTPRKAKSPSEPKPARDKNLEQLKRAKTAASTVNFDRTPQSESRPTPAQPAAPESSSPDEPDAMERLRRAKRRARGED
ncbi:MAG TPA: glutamine amidotransferase [Abditibacteriaceae bacterium]|jgi:uncharacterized membrane protein